MTIYNRYRQRPAAGNRSARIAWDVLTQEAAQLQPARSLALVWYAPEMQAWCAELNPVDDPKAPQFLEMDVLEVSDRRNNPHKYAAKP